MFIVKIFKLFSFGLSCLSASITTTYEVLRQITQNKMESKIHIRKECSFLNKNLIQLSSPTQ